MGVGPGTNILLALQCAAAVYSNLLKILFAICVVLVRAVSSALPDTQGKIIAALL